MKKMVFVMVFLLFLILSITTGCATASPKNPPPGYTGPVVNRPTFFPGEYWVFEKKDGTRIKWEFLREEAGLLVFQSGKRKDLLYTDRNRVAVKKINGKTGELIFERKPDFVNWLQLEFPMWIGRKWNFTYEVRSQNFGIMVPIDAECHVTAYEDVKIKNNTLKGFKIEGYWKARGYTDEGEYILYYLPEPKIWFNPESETAPLLVEYKVNTESISVK